MTEAQKILEQFIIIDGVHTACLVGDDGFLLESVSRSDIEAEMIGAIISSSFSSATSMGTQLGHGDFTMAILEYNEGSVLFSPAGNGSFLVIVTDKDTNIGWIKIAIKRNAEKIKQISSV